MIKERRNIDRLTTSVIVPQLNFDSGNTITAS